ncbi:peptidoglycan D,D-transpeptidase FtsI family protein [Sedimentisphaera salicampi]|uniref:Penicillin-binding protein 2 n=1 Tax=Sedimentisphaera salicampi TaxID=1941349 RepID=A0A1W6LP73_9BACT|nr:penicillin-binding protein 2 [Sedimentisphaera salicampi]ARN57580.1 Penicillin-binding protein 2 [Sedimentisphaera salicampi]
MKRNNHRMNLIFALILAAACAAAVKCVLIVSEKRPELEERLDAFEVTVDKRARRGVIVDARGNLLAVSKLKEDVFIDGAAMLSPYKNESRRHYIARYETIAKLEELLGLPDCSIEKKIYKTPKDRYRHIIVARGINQEQRTKFDKIFEYRWDEDSEEITRSRLYGTGIDYRWEREYPMGRLFCHTVGYAGQQKAGSEGLERYYFDLLSGEKGMQRFLVDSGRRPVSRLGGETGAKNGKSIILNLDSVIQMFASDALEKRCEKFKAESGFAIVMNPQTGGVMAMANYPDYDPENLGQSEPSSRRNRAVTDLFEPGSVVKPLIMAGAVDMGAVSKGRIIDCEDGMFYRRGSGRIQEYNYHRYGNLPLKEILIKSSNIGMAKIGLILKKKGLHECLEKIGFTYKTDIDLPGERSPKIRPLDRWTGYSVTRIPFGQEIGITGIQILRAYCAVANGGRSVRPYLAKAVIDNDGNTVQQLGADFERYGKIFSEDTCDFIMDALAGVVNSEDGTGKNAAMEDYTVFGKTGTANIYDPATGQYSNKHYTASFVGGAPFKEPRAVVLVSIRKPDRSLGMGYSGGRVSAPVVKEILDNTLDYLNVPPEKTSEK